MLKEHINVSSQVILLSRMKGDNKFDLNSELLKKSFIIQVLNKKITAFNLPIKITEFAYILLDLYSEGNPGFAQYLLSKVLENLKGKEKVITVDSIVDTWPFAYPTIDDNFYKWWDSQKTTRDEIRGSDNSVDTIEFWEKLMV